MKTTAYRKTLAVIFLLSLFIIQGCAGRRPMPVNRNLRSLKKETIRVKKVKYVPATLFCQIYGITWQWDAISYQLVLEKDEHRAVLRPDAEIILVDSDTVYLRKPVIFYKGRLLIPLSLVEENLDRIFNEYYYRIPVRDIRYRIDTIVIDPGHGGKDPGAIGRSGLREKDVVLDISKRLKRILERYRIKVILTRDTDRFISLWQRANIANTNKADFFISIHANAFRSRWTSGFEVYYLSDALDDNARAVEAAENAALDLEAGLDFRPTDHLKATLWDIVNTENRVESIELANVLCDSIEGQLYCKNRGVKSARFYVLKHAHAPSVLIEVGFISNKKEEAQLRKSSYRQEIADALAKGIIRYKTRYEETNGFTD